MVFTVKHRFADGKQSVVACGRYDIDKAARTITVYFQSGEVRTLKAEPDQAIYIENAYGRTIDTVRGNPS